MPLFFTPLSAAIATTPMSRAGTTAAIYAMLIMRAIRFDAIRRRLR